jgi:hypothetical protein
MTSLAFLEGAMGMSFLISLAIALQVTALHGFFRITILTELIILILLPSVQDSFASDAPVQRLRGSRAHLFQEDNAFQTGLHFSCQGVGLMARHRISTLE